MAIRSAVLQALAETVVLTDDHRRAIDEADLTTLVQWLQKAPTATDASFLAD